MLRARKAATAPIQPTEKVTCVVRTNLRRLGVIAGVPSFAGCPVGAIACTNSQRRAGHRRMSELAEYLRVHAAPESRTSILELRGLGKEIWKGIDAQEYVDRERAAWNG